MNFTNAPRVSPSEQFKILLPISKPVKIPLNVNQVFHYNKIRKKNDWTENSGFIQKF